MRENRVLVQGLVQGRHGAGVHKNPAEIYRRKAEKLCRAGVGGGAGVHKNPAEIYRGKAEKLCRAISLGSAGAIIDDGFAAEFVRI